MKEINNDLKSKQRMFRLLQGDVGSGKTIIALIAALNVIKSGFQVALMVPTEILAKQHYNFASDLFGKDISIELLTGKTEYKQKKSTLENIKQNKIKLIIGTHALFQKKVDYKNLGLIIIDEQHKFGVRQRKELSDKGGNNCDVLVMSATPIPRTMIMTIYGDMDVTLIKEKPKNRKAITTYSKLETKVDEIIESSNGVKIMGETNILNKLPVSASNLYAKNMFNFVNNLFDKENKKININLKDEIIEKTLIK